jgi:hypothetical protein
MKVSITKGSSPNTIRLFAGEPLPLSFHNIKDGSPTSLDDRAPVFAVYGPGRVEVDYFDATITTDERGPIAKWEISGDKSEAWYGQSLKFELSGRGKIGREVIVSGVITVDESAPRIDRLSTAPAARYIGRITRIDDASTSPAPDFEVTYADYAPTSAPPPPIVTASPFDFGGGKIMLAVAAI